MTTALLTTPLPVLGLAQPRRALPLAVVFGVMQAQAFAPTGWWWMQLLALTGLMVLLRASRSTRIAGLTGAAFGLGWFLSGIWWLYISMHVYGGMPWWMAALAVVLFSMYLSLYPALAGALWHRLMRHLTRHTSDGWSAPLLFAALWLLTEWLRGVILTGFPWLASGYAHTGGPLAGYAPVIGMYGIAGLSAMLAALVALTTWNRLRSALPGALAILVILFAGIGLRQVAWTQPAGQPISVRLLQGNVPQNIKFEPVGVEASLDLYARMITEAPADLIVTPETAFPIIVQQMPEALARLLRGFTDQSGSTLLFGAAGADSPVDFTNSVFGLSPSAPTVYRYDKHHLVPFGEFIPFGFQWFVDMMKMPLGDFRRGGPAQPPMDVHGVRIGPNICYEDLFGEEIAASLRQDHPANVLVNITNLAWFGDTIALDQHLQISQMRALETGRPMLRATNTGATAIVKADGSIQARLPHLTLGTLAGEVQGMEGLTPYVRTGNWAVVGLSVLILLAGLGRAARNSRGSGKTR